MVKDRLPDLRLVQRSQSYSSDEVCLKIGKKTNAITQFLDKVERIQNGIESINTNIDEIKRLNSIILLLPQGKGTSNSEVEDRKMCVSRTIYQVQYDIKGIQKLIEKDKEMPIDTLSTLARIQRIQYSTLVWLFADAVNNYNEMLLKHQARCKAIVHQQLQIINREATSEELEHLLENSEVAVFVDNIVADTLEAQLALTSVKARHGELLEVESSVKEIRDIFVQMATLVEAQIKFILVVSLIILLGIVLILLTI
ncbi:syntaxin-1A isoform X3 [Cryptotermes secundus]|uniref:syntaxin-1A isoform X3 n=1 Tax=Cryptotermes secundus TaxID=105785 RepID=UPI000CD7AE1C|nr:syntaxin-1A isoform X3 [Cryptotermes secundus]